MSFDALDRWLLLSAFFGFVTLMLGALIVLLVRQPVHRIRVIQCTLIATLMVPALQQFECLPSYTLNIWPSISPIPAQGNDLTSNTAIIETPRLAPPTSSSLSTQNLERPIDWSSSIPTSGPANLLDSSSISGPRNSDWFLSTVRMMSFGLVAKVLYFAGLILMMAVWIRSWFNRHSIARDSHLADDSIRTVLRTIGGIQAEKVKLLVSDRISSPIMWGWIRPTIVIPVSLAQNQSSLNLRYGLAHEFSHVARRDFLSLILANVTKLVCFYQPIFWWLRRQLAVSQDFLADAFAASQGIGPEDYASFLVSLARRRQSWETMGVLCMADRKSVLLHRVVMLVQATLPLQQKVSRRSALVMAALTISVIVGLSSMKLSASLTDEPQPPADSSKQPPATTETKLPKPITYTGKVIDKNSRKPIANANVKISRQVSRDPKTFRWIELESTNHTTNSAGVYSFTLPPEQVALSYLYIEATTTHPEYQPKGPEGYSHSMILKNLELGEPPFYETIELIGGEATEVRVLNPNKEVAQDVKILAYTKAPSKQRLTFESGAFQRAKTDANGIARIVVPTPGDGVLWIFPKDYVPVAVRLADKRGKLEDIVLKDGVRLTGQVLNTRGEPVPNVAVNVRRQGDGEDADDFLNQNAVSNHISSGAKTDAQGKFHLRPLPSGTYRAVVDAHLDDQATYEAGRNEEPGKLNDVFTPMTITIAEGSDNRPIEIQAVPHVTIRGTSFDSKGDPKPISEQHLFGKNNNEFFFVTSPQSAPDGVFEFKLPQGATDVSINLITNEHSSLKWRLKKDQPLQSISNRWKSCDT
jgi:beta-lactamase regulating signal transducer with metallopeptidase domain/protocatechuate 3,4-dioxygenase beta subunit